MWGHYGGSYKVTRGLAEKFGDLPVLDTPTAENSLMGMGTAAAMTGRKAVAEGMYMGTVECSTIHTSGGQFKIPILIRGPGGVGQQLGAEHSQHVESCFQ